MFRINWDVALVVTFCIMAIAFFSTMLIHVSIREEKCINNEIHYLVADKYWKGTGYSCNPLSSEETLDD